eukprot:Phypoly_transcript_10072.p1 GENE.Phypoly_transcript_10072~~Phypoly_transcript_10072.p1  ORF type:complete len:425 (+),score=61.48 Phypoly_transcript_10072:31-1275(+)
MEVRLILVLLCLSQSYGAALWGQIAGNAQHTALSTQTISNPSADLVPLWTRTSNSTILSGCVVDGEGSYLCYSGSLDGIYITKLLANGKPTWDQDILKDLQGCGFAPSLALDSVTGTLYAYTGQCVLGYNSENGNFLWKVENTVPFATALFMSVNEILHEGYLFGGGFLICITDTGKVKWNVTIFTPEDDTGAIGSPPAISEDGNSLFLHYSGGLINLNAANGATIWNVSLDGGMPNSLTFDSPVVDVTNNYIITLAPTNSSDSNLYVFDQKTGNIAAKFAIPAVFSWDDTNPVTAYQPMVLFQNGILVVNVNGIALYSFDLKTLSPGPTLQATANQKFTSIVGTQDGTLYALQGQIISNSLCAIATTTLTTLHCTQVNNQMEVYYPLVVGKSSFLLQYMITTSGIASYGQNTV